jgi:hypothetical protein
MSQLVYPVYTAAPAILRRAQAYLRDKTGIDSRLSKVRKQDGLLKVTPQNAARARQVLQDFDAPGRVISASEASFFFCYACQAPLSIGNVYCPQCGVFIEDAHAL